MNTFSAGEMITWGWETFKKRSWFFIGITILYCVISWIISAIVGSVSPKDSFSLIGVIINLVLSTFVNMGITAFALKSHDNLEAAAASDLWHPQHFLPYLIATIISYIVIAVGFVLLIVPGIILALMLWFTCYLVIDRNLGPIEALKESARITKGHKWDLFVLAILLFLLNVLGFVLLFVGLFVTIPISMLAIVHAYRTLSGQASVPAPAPAPAPAPVTPAAA